MNVLQVPGKFSNPQVRRHTGTKDQRMTPLAVRHRTNRRLTPSGMVVLSVCGATMSRSSISRLRVSQKSSSLHRNSIYEGYPAQYRPLPGFR